MAYSNHVVCYDLERRVPRYVAERLTREHVSGSANRKSIENEGDNGFRSDPIIDSRFSAKNTDFRGSGWSRGHMAAAANHKFDLSAMADTFFLTNIVPQDADNNSGFWNRLEWYCRGLTRRWDAVYIITGPLYLPASARNGSTSGDRKNSLNKRLLSVELIGDSGLHVPTHLFKAILVEKDGQPIAVSAFVVPNTPLPPSAKFTDFQVPLEELERLAGMQLFQLAGAFKSANRDLCRVDELKCQLSRQDEERLSKYENTPRRSIAAAAA